jgi:hypothetical protein
LRDIEKLLFVRGVRDPKRTQKFLSSFEPIRQHFALERHLLRAWLYRNQLAARFIGGKKSPKSAEICPALSERCSFLASFRLSLDKLTELQEHARLQALLERADAQADRRLRAVQLLGCGVKPPLSTTVTNARTNSGSSELSSTNRVR